MNIPTLGRFVMPDVVTEHFHIRAGDTVADFGAGSGYFLPALVAAVGEAGRVFACEVQRGLVDKLGDLVRTKGYTTVDVLWCDIESPHGIKLTDGCLDVGIVVNTIFQLEDAAAGFAEMRRVLRAGGKLCVVDWTESFGGLGPVAGQVVSKDSAIALAEAHGFVYEREYPAGDHHYGLAFRAV